MTLIVNEAQFDNTGRFTGVDYDYREGSFEKPGQHNQITLYLVDTIGKANIKLIIDGEIRVADFTAFLGDEKIAGVQIQDALDKSQRALVEANTLLLTEVAKKRKAEKSLEVARNETTQQAKLANTRAHTIKSLEQELAKKRHGQVVIPEEYKTIFETILDEAGLALIRQEDGTLAIKNPDEDDEMFNNEELNQENLQEQRKKDGGPICIGNGYTYHTETHMTKISETHFSCTVCGKETRIRKLEQQQEKEEFKIPDLKELIEREAKEKKERAKLLYDDRYKRDIYKQQDIYRDLRKR